MLEGQSAEMKQVSPRFGKEAQARVRTENFPSFRAIVVELLCHAPLRTPALQPRQRVMRCPSNSTRTPRVRVLTVSAKLLKPICTGEVSERFKEHAWKACVGEILPWVQIPPSPPYFFSVILSVLMVLDLDGLMRQTIAAPRIAADPIIFHPN